jgi:uncharacterized delta-60 repeat protein
MKTFIHLRLSAFALLLILVVDNPIVAQNPGDNDSTFNPTDLGFGFEGGINESVITSAVQSDDKIVVAGSYQGIVRLNSDETTDKTFSARELSGRYIYSLAIQKDGKIIIGGTFTSYDKTSRNSIARLHPDGSLDLSFDPGIGPWGEKGKDNELMPALIYSIALQSDGKIIIGGYFTSYNGIPRNRLARLNPDGSLDLTFNPGNGGSGAGTIRAIVIQNDGKIIVGGDLGIARINTDGSLDKSLINGSNSYVYTLALQQDEKIIAGGSFTDPNNTSKKGIIRLNPDGTPDATFNTGSDIEGILAIALQNDGKIIAVGDFKSFIDIRHDMVRLNADGSVDGLFKPAGDNKKIYTCAILSNGKIVVGGDFAFYKGIVKKNLAVLKTDGTLDIPYIIGTGANDIVNGITYDKGKTIIWGRFTAYNGVAVTHVARLNPDGNPDINFHPETIPEEEITALMPQTDGKILIARRFSSGTHPPGVVIRLNSDGTLDPGFKMEKVIVAIYAIAVQPDGKIIV